MEEQVDFAAVTRWESFFSTLAVVATLYPGKEIFHVAVRAPNIGMNTLDGRNMAISGISIVCCGIVMNGLSLGSWKAEMEISCWGILSERKDIFPGRNWVSML